MLVQALSQVYQEKFDNLLISSLRTYCNIVKAGRESDMYLLGSNRQTLAAEGAAAVNIKVLRARDAGTLTSQGIMLYRSRC